MSDYYAKIVWKRETTDFIYETYNRTHTLIYGGGISLQASAAPEFFGKAEHANPEEMLAGALASCHMLTFLAIAAKSKLIVDSYEDEPVASLGKNEAGQLAVLRVRLRPQIQFAEGHSPSPEKLKSLHEKAHKNCFIANSVKCQVDIE